MKETKLFPNNIVEGPNSYYAHNGKGYSMSKDASIILMKYLSVHVNIFEMFNICFVINLQPAAGEMTTQSHLTQPCCDFYLA